MFDFNEKSKETMEIKILLSKVFDNFKLLNTYQKRYIISSYEKSQVRHKIEYYSLMRHLINNNLLEEEDFKVMEKIIGRDALDYDWVFGPRYDVMTYIFNTLLNLITEDDKLTSFFN